LRTCLKRNRIQRMLQSISRGRFQSFCLLPNRKIVERKRTVGEARAMRPVETFSSTLRRYKTSRDRFSAIARATQVGNKRSKLDEEEQISDGREGTIGPSTDLQVIAKRLSVLALPYWQEGPQVREARLKLGAVVALTLGTTGVSVLFSYLGRDFFNALSAKDQAKFTEMLTKWLFALCVGIPVFVLRDYYQSKLALDWREWMTKKMTSEYFENRKFYKIQASAMLDNPDQRIAVDIGQVYLYCV